MRSISYSTFTFVLKMIATMVAATVMYFLTIGEEARQIYHEFGSIYFDSVIIDNSFEQGQEEAEIHQEYFDAVSNPSLTFEN